MRSPARKSWTYITCIARWLGLGEVLPPKEQEGRTPFAPRCVKDIVEERLFDHRRDLLTRLDLVFVALSDQVKRFVRFFPIYPHSVHSWLQVSCGREMGGLVSSGQEWARLS